MIDRLRQMAIFVKTIDHGSFRAAAKVMNVSPSVVSHQVAQLEKHLGSALMYRSTRTLSLTRDGEQLLSFAREMMEAADRGLQSVSEKSSQPSGELRITMPAVMAHSQLIKQLAEFSVLNKKVKLTLDFSDARKSLISDGFDLAIRMGWLKDSALIATKLKTENRKLVASNEYLATRPQPISPKDLNDWDWLDLSPARNAKLVFRQKGSKPVPVKPVAGVSVNNAFALYQFVRSGAGLGVVPEFLAEADVKNGKMTYVLSDWQLEEMGIYAVWPENAPKNGLTKFLVDYLVKSQVR